MAGFVRNESGTSVKEGGTLIMEAPLSPPTWLNYNSRLATCQGWVRQGTEKRGQGKERNRNDRHSKQKSDATIRRRRIG